MPRSAFVLPLRGLLVFPGMIRALPVGRPSSVAAVEGAVAAGERLVLVPQLDPAEEEPLSARHLVVGVAADVLQLTHLPDGSLRVLVEGKERVLLKSGLRMEEGATRADVGRAPTSVTDPVRVEALARELAQLYEEVASASGVSPEEHTALVAPDDAVERLGDQVAGTLAMSWEQRLTMLAELDLVARLELLLQQGAVAVAQQRIQVEVNTKLAMAMDQSQREYHLKEQLKILRAELGDAAGPDAEADAFEKRLDEAGVPEAVRAEAQREIARLRRITSDSAEYNVARTWLETVCEIPWSTVTQDDVRLDRAEQVLEEDHHGLDKVKERIVEYLAVRQLRKDAQGAILCFVGAPGVGKTSLGRSIARSMGRSFARVSLGGIKDESEIRGHRRTYVGALPGRIVQALIRAGTRNPVIVLDEIDKLGADFRGDPASALLEVLDPEQNGSFVDHYLDVPVDLSQVLFIATANLVDPIPHALYDRFEILEIPGYTQEEKVAIAKRFLLPRVAEEHGLHTSQLKLPDATLHRIVQDYTREAGLRSFQRQLAQLARKVARRAVEGKRRAPSLRPEALERWLGPPRYFLEVDDRDDLPGVVIGLAWTESGGDILYVECVKMPGTAGLKLTGSLGDVMKESAEAALSWLRAHADDLSLDADAFSSMFHLHVPAGAIPKDGPSAGVSMVTALASRLTGRPVKPRLAMTGEITLRGKVLPVGGVKEKVLAARRAGVREILLPRHNLKDLAELPAEARKDIVFHPADTIRDVLGVALGLA